MKKLLHSIRWLCTLALLAGTTVSTSVEAQTLRANGRQSLEFPAVYYNANLSPTIAENHGPIAPRAQFTHGNFADPGMSYSAARANDVLYTSGPVFNVDGPPKKSMLQSSLGMTTLGANASDALGYAMADDFTLTENSDINSIEFYAYQTGAQAGSLNAVYVQIWDGVPGAGGNVVWGDATTNRIVGVGVNGGFRVSETSPNDTTRIVQIVTANTSGLTLDAGTYYVQVAFAGTGASGPWAPPVTINGQATTGNGLQYTGTAWQPWLDTGSNTAQGLPFKIIGQANSAPITYCIPAGTNSSYYINNFTTTGGATNISNTNSGFSTGGYGDFYDTHTVTQVPGGTINFEAGFPTGQTYGVRIWVDWNQDGVFSETEEVAWQSSAYGNPHTGSFNVPASALPGATRMRVVGHWLNSSGNISPCATNHTYGEFEDYKIIVGTLDACTGTPDGGAAAVSPANGNAGSTYSVSASGFEQASGLSFQWESKTTGDWVAQGAASTTYAPYTATAQGEVGNTTEWRLKVTCTASAQSAYSTTATFTISLVYCTASSSTTEPITRVIFADIDNASPRTGGPGYQDFTSITAHVNAGETYEIKCEGNTDGNYTNHFVAWIDWNQNGTFEANERTEIGSIQNSTGNDGQQAIGSITVPADALEGTTRMRIIKNFNSASTNPCGTNSFGQVEDYTVEVNGGGTTDPGEDCSLSAASNNFENGASVTKAGNRVVAQDVVVAAGKDMELTSIVASLIMSAGVSVQNADIVVYENNGGMPGAVVTTLTDVVPVSSVSTGTLSTFTVYDVTFDANVTLSGDASNDTTYWVGLSVLTNDASNLFWEFSTAALVGLPQAFYDGNTWASQAGREGVYTFNAECTDHEGTTGPDCSFGDITTTSFDNAYNIEGSNAFHTAAGFEVAANTTFTMDTITVDVNQQEVPNTATLVIREDVNGTPGGAIETIIMAPSSSNIYGSAFGDPVYHLTFDLATPVVLPQGNYWLDAKMSTPSGQTVWWLASSEGSNPIIPQRSTDGGVTWAPDTNGLYLIFSVSGSCDAVVGIDDNAYNGFTFYPNPVDNVLYLKADAGIESVSGFNILGQQVINNRHFNSGQVDVSHLPAGAYLFQVKFTNGNQETFRVLKK